MHSFFKKALDQAGKLIGLGRAGSDARRSGVRRPRAPLPDERGQPEELREPPPPAGYTLENVGARLSLAEHEWAPGVPPLQEPPSRWRALWAAELVRHCCQPGEALADREEAAAEAPGQEATEALVRDIFRLLDGLAGEYNPLAKQSALAVSVTAPSAVKELRAAERSGPVKQASYIRCRASTATLTLSVRGSHGQVEIFILPAGELFLLGQSELPERLAARLRFDTRLDGGWWVLDGCPLDRSDLRVLVRQCFKDLVFRSAGELESEEDMTGHLLNLEGARLSQAMRDLLAERQGLVQKIIMQQEEIQNRIARDLHDAVIADVMALKRSLTGDKRLSEAEIVQSLDKVTQHLRDICHDLAPRDLKDWGLQTVIEDLLNRVGERTGADCSLVCDEQIPELPSAVELHIFRIVQECLNNIEKYAHADKVAIRIDLKDDTLSFTIKDNGVGFDAAAPAGKRGRTGGMGMGGLRERTELIRSYFPARFNLKSEAESGTTIRLDIKLRGTFASAAPEPPHA